MTIQITHGPKRVALLGLMLESNRFAPVTTRQDFLDRLYMGGDAILGELPRSESAVMAEMLGFAQDMTANADWSPVPILAARVEAGGPIDDGFFRECLAIMRERLLAAMPLDGVYIANHGAMITPENEDPDGEMFAMVRAIVGPHVPVIATLDLHANISERMMRETDVIVGYRTNPHVDMYPRGADAAQLMRRHWQGERFNTAFVRLPLVGPTVTLLTASGPFADLMQHAESMLGGTIVSISLFPGFAYSDTAKNGMAIMATSVNGMARAVGAVESLAHQAWDDRFRFVPRLTSLADAAEACLQTLQDPSRAPVILADVADNPGGGGLGNTTAILRHWLARGVATALLGLFHDPVLAQEAASLGAGAEFTAVFNRSSDDPEAGRLSVPARVERVSDGLCTGRRGIYAGRRMDLGTTVLLDVSGIKVVVNSLRWQCADPAFFELMGIDLAQARVVAVKSRGHFRSGFDEFFGPSQVIEVDGPGLCSPILARFDFRHYPRPIFPLDPEAVWTPEIMTFPARPQ